MKRTFISLAAVTCAALTSIQLTGCDATDAAYFNLAAQCYSRYPNDSWAQQQCVDQGSAIISDYQAEQQCDNEVAFHDRQLNYYWDMGDANRRLQDETYNMVAAYSGTIQQCLRQRSYNECYQQHTGPTLTQISQTRNYLNQFHEYQNTVMDYRQGLINRCSRYYTFGRVTFENSSYFTENHNVYNAWQSSVTDRTDYWRRYYNR
ncbi:hypothetical protein [Aliidiomarina indica]|uniref:hypothetical protein n=1 Tax=Aliidiomarina indica TaxID=2749147 RepID=UPI00188EBC10|nr:hypothetical protein [Aliidiomarina indica]